MIGGAYLFTKAWLYSLSVHGNIYNQTKLGDPSLPELGLRTGCPSNILRRKAPWEADRIVLNRAITMSLVSCFCLSFTNSLNFRSIADCSEREWLSLSYRFLALFLQRLSISTFATLDSWSKDSSSFFLLYYLSLRRSRSYLLIWISLIIWVFYFRDMFSFIFLSTLALICFSKELTSNCILFCCN